ncbi:hypothetical protein ACWEKT_21065 [Nocardia takedensis]
MIVGEKSSNRDRSAAIFGNRYLVEVVIAIAELVVASPEGVTVRMITRQTGVADGSVKQVVTRLVAADLLRVYPRNTARGPLFHSVNRANGTWAALLSTCRSLIDSTTGGAE